MTKAKAMVVDNVLRMNAGDGDTSYANNSYFQKDLMLKVKPLLEDAIKDMVTSGTIASCFKIADLGCSSGPNTFLAVSGIINVVNELCKQMNREMPEFQVFLNDLPGNDFNSIFKLTPTFHKELKKGEKEDKLGHVFITGVPGSFYDRLFPSKSLNFVHSSSSVHWLSQVPDGLEDNKGCIYMSKKSPPQVLKAYAKQFERDFSVFLTTRAEELAEGGRMALELSGRSSADPTCKDCYYLWQPLADSLLDMAAEGIVKEADVDSFNMPYYTPYVEEVRKIIKEEGSFNLEKLEPIEYNGGAIVDHVDIVTRAHMVALSVRAIMEPMLSSHFGSTIMDNLFVRFAERIRDVMAMEKGNKAIFLTMSLTKK